MAGPAEQWSDEAIRAVVLQALLAFRERCAQEADYEEASQERRRGDGSGCRYAAKHIREIDVVAWLRAGCPDREPRLPR